MTDKLPSIDDFYEELPSKDEVIKEEKLPSINEFVEEEEEEVVEEKNKCKEGEYFCNDEQKCKPIPKGTRVRDDGLLVKEGDLVEVLNLINSVKNDIPEIPEIKYYDDELESLVQRIEEIQKNIPEVKYYDSEVEAICEEIDSVKHNIANLPEVKYYDEQLSGLEKRLVNLKESLPEVKYYDGDIQSLDAKIDKVRSEIPNFPKWINEVNEVPDFSWIGKTFSIIDDDFLKVGDNIKDLRDRFDADFQDLSESLDTKDFEQRVNLDEVKQDIKETKEKIFKELKEAAIKIWSHHDMFKDDDRKLKKQIFSKLNETKQKIEKQILDSRTKSYQENKELSNYFNGLQKEISNLPEVKYYDTPIQELKKGLSKLDEKIDNKLKDATLNIAELYKIVDELKDEQQLLVETNIPLGADSPETNNPDPLTPIDQDFVTVDQLQRHYKLFVERVQYQLSSIGGGGAGFIKDLDDVDITGLADDYILQYDASTSKWKTVANNVGAGGTWTVGEAGIHTTKSVGIGTTARSDFKLYVSTGSTADTVAYFDGNISIAGSTFSREVVEIESLGIITATKGVDVISGGVDITAGGLNVTAGVSTFSGIGTFGNSVFIDGDLRCVGVATFGSSSITIDGSNNVVNVGAGITIDAAAQTITVGTSKIADPTGDANYAGVVTATTFDGNLATTNLTGTITNAQLAGSIANDKLAGSIANDKLANSTVSLGGISIALGETDATPAFNLSDATNYPFTSLTGITTTILGDTTPKLGGDLNGNSKNIFGVGILTATTFDGSLATTNLTGTITNAQLAGSIANDKLSNSTVSLGGISLALGETDATPAFDLSDATNYPTSSLSGTITNAQLAGSIANDKLSNSTVSFGGISLALGGTDATPAFNLSDATNYPFTSLTGITTTIVGDTTPKLGGDLNGNSKNIFGVGILTATSLSVTDVSATGVTTVGILTSYESISIGSTNLFTEISKKTSIGLALALS